MCHPAGFGRWDDDLDKKAEDVQRARRLADKVTGVDRKQEHKKEKEKAQRRAEGMRPYQVCSDLFSPLFIPPCSSRCSGCQWMRTGV